MRITHNHNTLSQNSTAVYIDTDKRFYSSHSSCGGRCLTQWAVL